MTNAWVGFRHEALFYARPSEFVTRVGSFVADAVAADEPVLVLVSEPKICALQSVLGSKADAVHWADMDRIGRNPGRIIAAWQDFIDEHQASRRCVRGVGEPIDANRDADEVIECHRHEALLNVAFANSSPWWLMCPYDTSTLAAPVIAEARRNHPYLRVDGAAVPNPLAVPLDVHARRFDADLEPAPGDADQFDVSSPAELHELRESVVALAAKGGVPEDRLGDVAVVVDELVANAIVHGSDWTEVRAWVAGESVVFEVRDGGALRDPLAGRCRPALENESGRGLWIVHQLSDLVQQRTRVNETVTRVRFSTTA